MRIFIVFTSLLLAMALSFTSMAAPRLASSSSTIKNAHVWTVDQALTALSAPQYDNIRKALRYAKLVNKTDPQAAMDLPIPDIDKQKPYYETAKALVSTSDSLIRGIPFHYTGALDTQDEIFAAALSVANNGSETLLDRFMNEEGLLDFHSVTKEMPDGDATANIANALAVFAFSVTSGYSDTGFKRMIDTIQGIQNDPSVRIAHAILAKAKLFGKDARFGLMGSKKAFGFVIKDDKGQMKPYFVVLDHIESGISHE